MAFLDNSGDIILDAVLTDEGRARMARGDFRIVKFAFSDEEINYGLFNPNAANSDSFDLEIMQTPILESFTNNTSLMKTKLISINRTNVLYLPTFLLNTKLDNAKQHALGETYVVLADTATEPTNAPGSLNDGVLHGVFGSGLDVNQHYIALDQGMETGGNPPRTHPMPSDLVETAYIIRMDHRLLRLTGFANGAYERKALSFVDDDQVSSYLISTSDGSVLGTANRIARIRSEQDRAAAIEDEMFNGPLGPRLRFSVITSESVQQSIALFDEIGTVGSTTLSINGSSADNLTSGNYKFIDTIVNIVGISSGYSIDVPIRIVKKTT